jgi:RimJ/RimL family protein N-acetyltransferase
VQKLRDFAVDEMLKNGSQVLIRAIRPDDKEAMLNGFANLSGHSRQLRFFGFKNEINDRELQYYTEVDDIHHVALVVIVKDNGNERVIGGGRYMEYDVPGHEGQAEVAFAVVDEFQGLGLATMLFKHLVRIARKNGLKEFKAEVLRENSSMLKVFEHSGLPIQRSVDSGVVDVTLDLG